MGAYAGPTQSWGYSNLSNNARFFASTKLVVQSGLVMNLDAGVSSSYPGTGTTWTDLSGNGNTGTLKNGPTYDSANGGSFSFDGSNDHTLLPLDFFPYPYFSIPNPIPPLTAFTISIWFKSSQANGGTLFGQQNTDNPSSASGFVPVIYLRSDGFIRIEPFWTGNNTNFILSSSTLNNNNWHNVITTFNSGTNQLYVNGVYNTQQTGKTLTAFTNNPNYIVGAGVAIERSLGTNYFSGNISNFNFYNRALTATEISQNFNAIRARFGI
jgi:hypothetical protein